MKKGSVLKAEVREHTGSGDAAKMRKSGRVPAIVYGHKQEPVAISLDTHTLVEELHHGRRLLDVQIGTKSQKVIVKELQYDHLGRNIIHADLMRVDVTEKIKVTVPIEFKGTAKGTHEGGVISVHADRLEIECKATDIPESVAVSVKEVGVGDTLHAGDITLPEGVKLVSDQAMLLITCGLVAAPVTTEVLEAEAPVAPEVITEVKKTEEKEGEEKSVEEAK